jgi:hypothetical protein
MGGSGGSLYNNPLTSGSGSGLATDGLYSSIAGGNKDTQALLGNLFGGNTNTNMGGGGGSLATDGLYGDSKTGSLYNNPMDKLSTGSGSATDGFYKSIAGADKDTTSILEKLFGINTSNTSGGSSATDNLYGNIGGSKAGNSIIGTLMGGETGKKLSLVG